MAQATRTPTELEVAHQAFIAAISATAPNNIRYCADADDLEARAAHLSKVLAATLKYAQLVIADTQYVANVIIDDNTGYLSDANTEVVGAITSAINTLHEEAA